MITGNEGNMVIAYPNPAKENLFVDIDLQSANSATVKLVDIVGNGVATQELKEQSGLLNFDVSNLAKGVYFLQVLTSDQNMQTVKVVIQ